MTPRHALRLVLAFAALPLVAAGCTTDKQAFPGYPSDQVWTALKGVAESPDYTDAEHGRWFVMENQVHVDEERYNIEIYRQLRRDRYEPGGAAPFREKRELRLNVTLDPSDPPTARIKSRGFGVPAHAWRESDRYFDTVWQTLGNDPADRNPKTERPVYTSPDAPTQP